MRRVGREDAITPMIEPTSATGAGPQSAVSAYRDHATQFDHCSRREGIGGGDNTAGMTGLDVAAPMARAAKVIHRYCPPLAGGDLVEPRSEVKLDDSNRVLGQGVEA